MGRLKGRVLHLVTFWLVKDLLKAVHEDEILTQKGNGWYIGERRLPQEELSFLKEEAKHFRDSYLWRLMSKEIRFMAYLRATSKARTNEDLIYSGAMYYNLELLETFMANCKNL